MRASGNNSPLRREPCPQPGPWRRLCASALALVSIPLAAAPAEEHRVHDLYYGQALYQYFQQNDLAAITQLLVAREKPRRTGGSQVDEANLLLADLFYRYGLYEESRGQFAQLLNAEVSDSVQNRIWFNLAQLRYEQGYYDQARDLLSRIDDQLPGRIEAERKYLLTNLFLGSRQYDQAADLSNRIDSDSIWRIYARYNLGVTLIEDNEYSKGEHILDELGQMEPSSPEALSLRDLANLSLGLKQLRMQAPEAALQSLSRVRLEGPLSNRALLASGWAWYRLGQFDRAQVPWRLLLQRNAVDAATQEAILAIPANYAESGQDRLAIRHYDLAANQFDLQLAMLQDAIRSIDNNELIAALRENALLHDHDQLQRLPPSSRVTPQLHLLLASSGFHHEIKRYQELLDIRDSLGYWGKSVPALKLMLSERRRAFTKKLPKLQQTGSFDQLEQLGQRRDQYMTRVDAITSREDYLALARAQERDQLLRLQRVAASIDKISPQRDTASQRDMLRVLSGLLHYRLATEYPARLWKVKKQMLQLDRALDVAKTRASKLRRITRQTELDFAAFQGRIVGQTQKIETLRERVVKLLQQQEQHINRLAIDAIRAQQQHIVQLRLNARFELARLYDRLAAPQ
jgi:predicted negative regulator of RcsB-dependent stress response